MITIYKEKIVSILYLSLYLRYLRLLTTPRPSIPHTENTEGTQGAVGGASRKSAKAAEGFRANNLTNPHSWLNHPGGCRTSRQGAKGAKILGPTI